MPTYQYKREDGSIFEITQKISEEALRTCPETGQKVKRVITGGGGVVYKGTGWYVTDYKNKSNVNVNNGSNGDSNKTATPTKETSDGTAGNATGSTSPKSSAGNTA